MTTEQLSGRALDEAIAVFVGWERRAFEHEGMVFRDLPWHDTTTDHYGPRVPAYSSSVDALREPEARAFEAGYWPYLSKLTEDIYEMRWEHTNKHIDSEYGDGPTEAIARARAVHAVLTAIAAIEKGETDG